MKLLGAAAFAMVIEYGIDVRPEHDGERREEVKKNSTVAANGTAS